MDALERKLDELAAAGSGMPSATMLADMLRRHDSTISAAMRRLQRDGRLKVLRASTGAARKTVQIVASGKVLDGAAPVITVARDVGSAATRACLCCKRDFASQHRFNRLCGPCKETDLFDDGGAVYLHHYLRSDPDRGVHDHPWDHAIAVQLAGGYFEERFAGVSPEGLRKAIKRRPAGRGYLLKGSDFHRVLVGTSLVSPTSWSLFAHGPYRKGWGFLEDDGRYDVDDGPDQPIIVFRPFKNDNDGSSKWWRDRQKHPPGREQKRADAWGRPMPESQPLDLQSAARLAEDLQ